MTGKCLRFGGFALFLLVSFVGFASCGGGGNGNERDQERVRFLHAGTKVKAIRVLFNGEEYANDLTYGEYADYRDVAAGKLRIRVESDEEVLPVVEDEVTIEEGQDYTVVLNRTAEGKELSNTVDDNSYPDPGEFRLRIGNFAATPGAVDVYVSMIDGKLTDEEPVAAALAPQSYSAYLSIKAGGYRIRVTPAGNKKTVLVDTGRLFFDQDTIRTMEVLDAPNGGYPTTVRFLQDSQF